MYVRHHFTTKTQLSTWPTYTKQAEKEGFKYVPRKMVDDKRERALKEANYERCSAGFNIAGGMFYQQHGVVPFLSLK